MAQNDSEQLHVRHYMAKNFVTLKPDQQLADAINQLNNHQVFSAPVVDNLGNLVGMLSGSDCIEISLKTNFHRSWRGTVDSIMTRDVVTVDAHYSILYVAKMFAEGHLRRFPVIEDSRVIGIIGRTEVLMALEKVKQ